MITAILNFFLDLVAGLLDGLPTIAAPDLEGLMGSMAPFFEFFGWLNYYLPVQECVTALGIYLTAWLVMHAVTVTIWVLTKAHVLGGSSTN